MVRSRSSSAPGLLVYGRDSCWASHPDKTLEDLLGFDWVLRESRSGTRSVFEAAIAAAGI
jgi:hypothetical protein